MNNKGFQYLHPLTSVIIFALLFVSLITPLSAAMTPQAHQKGINIAKDYQILFDKDFEVVDSIPLNNEDYFIIRQKNLFLFTNRLNIYKSDGSVVRDSNLSKSIFEVYAWKQQIDKLKAMDRSDLRGVLTTSENIGSKVAPLHQVTGTVVSAIDEAKAVKVKGICVWDTAAKLNPELKTFENTVRSFNTEVGEWDSASFNVNANLPDVIKGLDSIDRGEKIDWTGFAYDTKASVTAFNELNGKTSQMSRRISDIRETLDNVNKGLSSIGAGFLADAFNDLDGKLGSVQDSIDGYSNRLNKFSREFSEISRDVERIERNIEHEWINSLDDKSALKLIYSLLIAIIIGIIVAIITGLTDFRRRLIVEKAVLFSSVKQGLSMFAGSIFFGFLIILAFAYQVKYITRSDEMCFSFLINIPFLSSYPVASWQVFIFLMYVVSSIVIFATIYGMLAKKDKVDCIVPFWLGNCLFLLLLFSGYMEDNIIAASVSTI